MAFRLEPNEPVGDGLRRVAHEQLRSSVRRLSEGTDDRDDDIHSARKSMKRLRGLVRLVRRDLGGARYRQDNATYRDAARRLASLRDATVLVASLDRLHADDDAGAAGVRPLREALARQREDAYDAAQNRDEVLGEVVEQLRAADERVDDWPLESTGWATLDDGLGRVYRRGRAECDEALWRPSVEHLHQWRKRVKYLWYHTQLLGGLWPGPLAAWEAELDRLGDLLGDDHDLAVLADAVRRGRGEPGFALDAAAAEALLRRIGDARQRLQGAARILGMRLYAEPAKALSRRLRVYHAAWEEERILAAGVPAPVSSAAGVADVAERVADTCCRTGEGPLWHPEEARLYWLDIPAGHLWCHDPATGTHERVFAADGPIGGMTLQADGALLLFLGGGAIAVWRRGEPLRTVVDGIDVERESRFNDVIADPAGRVFCGTMPGPGGDGGRLYRLDRDGTLTELFDRVGCSNGMGFTPDDRHLYFIDSPTKVIARFAYDAATGELGARDVFVDTTDEEGVPDGMTVDAEGHVWCARWGGGCLVRYAPDGAEVARVELPARKVSSAAFGGPELADLYVTTAGGDDREAGGAGAGALFHLRPGVRGRPEFRSRIGL